MENVIKNIMKKMDQINYGFKINEIDVYPKSDEEWSNEFSKHCEAGGKNYFIIK